MSDKIPIRFIRRKQEQLERYCSAVKIDEAEGVCVATECPRWRELISTGVCPANTDWQLEKSKE